MVVGLTLILGVYTANLEIRFVVNGLKSFANFLLSIIYDIIIYNEKVG